MGAATIEEYLAGFPDDVRAIIVRARYAVRAALPDANERISYGMIRFDTAGGHAVFLGGWKSHLGMYPVPVTKGKLEHELSLYRATKDTLHFRYDSTMPFELLGRAAGFAAARA
ncbi:MAG: DUF1801 domain-containing protein [Terrimesophilobacter sp.]